MCLDFGILVVVAVIDVFLSVLPSTVVVVIFVFFLLFFFFFCVTLCFLVLVCVVYQQLLFTKTSQELLVRFFVNRLW